MAPVDKMHWALATLCGFDLFIDQRSFIIYSNPSLSLPIFSNPQLEKFYGGQGD